MEGTWLDKYVLFVSLIIVVLIFECFPLITFESKGKVTAKLNKHCRLIHNFHQIFVVDVPSKSNFQRQK